MVCKVDYAAYVRTIMPDRNGEREAESGQREGMYLRYTQYIKGESRISSCISGIGAGIYPLTYRRKYIYIPHGQKQIFRSKISSAPETGQSQPLSRKSRRSVICDLGLFRCPRSGPGQVRDGSQGSGGSSTRRQQCEVFRFFTSFLLPGAGPAGERRSGGSGAAKAGAEAQAQAGCRGNEVPSGD